MRTPAGDWSWQPVDGGLLHFNRAKGVNLLERGSHTIDAIRVAPRVLQVGLLTPCNLSCSFCYRDTRAPSRLSAPFLTELLQRAAEWGVLEVAFGGGEPLLFKGFTELVSTLRSRTTLGLNLTTNGTLLNDAVIDALRGNVGEIRVSAYSDNAYRATLRRLAAAGVPAGVNWLVTPANVGRVAVFVRDFLACGAKNVLLLGYKGADQSLHLDAEGLAILRRQLGRLDGAPMRLDICWYPLLRDLPHLFGRSDCGAGDEFLVITPDRAVQSCSFSTERIPFETLEDLRSIWQTFRSRRDAAKVGGCTRSLFRPVEVTPPPTRTVWQWEAHASNNSGDWTIVGRFERAEQASRAAEALRELSRAHEAYLKSPAGQQWIQRNGYNGEIPSPPLRSFGEAHGFDWSKEGDGLWWEEDGAGAPVLTAGALGEMVVVYHPYCMGLPEEPFRSFLARVGAVAFGYWQYDRPRTRVRAKGDASRVLPALDSYAAGLADHEDTTPPWGAEADDPRLGTDEDRDARSEYDGKLEVRQIDGGIEITLGLRNCFAGPLALAAWLERNGLTHVEVELLAEGMERLDPPGDERIDPRTGLFGDVRPLKDRLHDATHEQVIRIALETALRSDLLDAAVARVPEATRLELGRRLWTERRTADAPSDLHRAALRIAQTAERHASAWAEELWEALVASGDIRAADLFALAKTVGPDASFERARRWAARAADRPEGKRRLALMARGLRDPRTLDLIEEWWQSASDEQVTTEWGAVIAASGLDWPRARQWLLQDRRWRRLAIGALRAYQAGEVHAHFDPPTRKDFVEAVSAALAVEEKGVGPAVRRDLLALLESPGALVR